jgi:hypothetical protein
MTTTHTGAGQYGANGITFPEGRTLASGAAFVTDTYELVMQTDGNLVVYNDTGAAVWASGTAGHPGANALMRGDGNFVIFADQAQTQSLWSTGTTAAGGTQSTFNTDGTFTVRNSGGGVVWSTTDTFTAGMTLQPGEQYLAAFGRYEFAMQGDGNLVEYNGARTPIWASNTSGHPGAFATVQTDGNFVVYSDQSRSHALWATGTNGSGATELLFQNDGNLVVYRANYSVAWASNTAGK